MTIPMKPIWAEGVFLGQQHLQQWDCYIEEKQKWWVHVIAPLAWGIQSLSIDNEALLNGVFRIKSIRAIYPSGECIVYQQNNKQSLTCKLNPTKEENISMYIGLPTSKNVSGINGYHDASQLVAWSAHYENVKDIYDTNREREVMFAKQNLLLLQGSQSNELYETLKIAEIIRQGHNKFKLSTSFIPTCLHIHASKALLNKAQQLCDIITAKKRNIIENTKQIYQRKNELGVYSSANLLISIALNQASIQLRHILKYSETHPDKLYYVLANLASTLCVFTKDKTLINILDYDHNNLTSTFNTIYGTIKNALESIAMESIQPITILRESKNIYRADNLNASLLENTHFLLVTSFHSDDNHWQQQFSQQVKIASSSHIDNIINSALRGVNIAHTQYPPANCPNKPNHEYFLLQTNGDFWNQIKHERSLSLFIPDIFCEATIELMTCRD